MNSSSPLPGRTGAAARASTLELPEPDRGVHGACHINSQRALETYRLSARFFSGGSNRAAARSPSEQRMIIRLDLVMNRMSSA